MSAEDCNTLFEQHVKKRLTGIFGITGNTSKNRVVSQDMVEFIVIDLESWCAHVDFRDHGERRFDDRHRLHDLNVVRLPSVIVTLCRLGESDLAGCNGDDGVGNPHWRNA